MVNPTHQDFDSALVTNQSRINILEKILSVPFDTQKRNIESIKSIPEKEKLEMIKGLEKLHKLSKK